MKKVFKRILCLIPLVTILGFVMFLAGTAWLMFGSNIPKSVCLVLVALEKTWDAIHDWTKK